MWQYSFFWDNLFFRLQNISHKPLNRARSGTYDPITQRVGEQLIFVSVWHFSRRHPGIRNINKKFLVGKFDTGPL